jgi:structure-specific recognition protein 1
MFVPKPATYHTYDQIQAVTFSRVGGAVSANMTFDITIRQKDGRTSQFMNIKKDDQQLLEEFLKSKGIRVKNEVDDIDPRALDHMVEDSSDEEIVVANVDRGSADEDDESVDEDFQADSESDVAEEYDSNAESSGGSDDDDDAGGEDEKGPPKKKKKDH